MNALESPTEPFLIIIQNLSYVRIDNYNTDYHHITNIRVAHFPKKTNYLKKIKGKNN